jgi:Na+-transporting methylmalonyl-CoA/oxaloacetate decarboxylase gamma subunit
MCVFVFLVYYYFVLRLIGEMIGRRREVEERRRSGLLRNEVRK